MKPAYAALDEKGRAESFTKEDRKRKEKEKPNKRSGKCILDGRLEGKGREGREAVATQGRH